MINTTLPVLETELDEAKSELIRKTHDIKVKIDVSVFAERRWEENFPQNAKTETLFAYVERMSGKDLKNPAYLLSNLKAIYCFIVSDEIADFDSFLQMFDMSDIEYLTRLINKIKFVFEIALKAATTSAKNS